MTEKAIRWVKLAIIIACGIIGGIGGALHVPYLPLVLLPAVFIALFFLGRSVKGRVKDERLISLAYKAARISFVAYVLPAVVLGNFLIQYDLQNGNWGLVGWTLLISTAFLTLVYYIAYIVLTRKY